MALCDGGYVIALSDIDFCQYKSGGTALLRPDMRFAYWAFFILFLKNFTINRKVQRK